MRKTILGAFALAVGLAAIGSAVRAQVVPSPSPCPSVPSVGQMSPAPCPSATPRTSIPPRV